MNLAELGRRLSTGALGRLWRDTRGQDMIEYALMAVMVAVAVYGVLPSNYAASLSTIWSKVHDQLIICQTYN